MKVGVAVIDLATGLSTVGAITTALYQREKTLKGTKIDCSLLETQVNRSTNDLFSLSKYRFSCHFFRI